MTLSELTSKLRGPSEARRLLKSAFDQTRMAMIATDPRQPDNPIVAVSRAFEVLTGYDEAETVGRNCRFLQGEETDRDEVARLRRCIEEEGSGYFELLNYRRDGTSFWTALHVGPVYGEDGELIFFFGSQWDVTERVEAVKQVESEAQLTTERLEAKTDEVRRLYAAVDQATDAMMLTEYDISQPGGPKIVWVNRSFETMAGYTRDEVVGRTPSMLQGERTDRKVLDAIRAALGAGEGIAGQRTINYRRDGTPYHVEWSISPVTDAEGHPTHWLSVQRDVTDEVQAETNQMVADELEHRHKNVLSLVSALISLMPDDGRSVPEFKAGLRDKITAMSAAHDLVFQSPDEAVSVAELADRVLAPFPRARIERVGGPVTLGAKNALNLALVLHELATNAMKYGALSVPDGQVSLRWWRAEDGHDPAVWFDWIEAKGPTVSPPSRRGFGSVMMAALLRSDHRPDAGVDYDAAGVVCRGGIPAA